MQLSLSFWLLAGFAIIWLSWFHCFCLAVLDSYWDNVTVLGCESCWSSFGAMKWQLYSSLSVTALYNRNTGSKWRPIIYFMSCRSGCSQIQIIEYKMKILLMLINYSIHMSVLSMVLNSKALLDPEGTL